MQGVRVRKKKMWISGFFINNVKLISSYSDFGQCLPASHPSLKLVWSPSPRWQWPGKDQRWMEAVILMGTTWRKGRRRVYNGSRFVSWPVSKNFKHESTAGVTFITSIFYPGGEGHYQRHQAESHQPGGEQWVPVPSLCCQQGWCRKLLWAFWPL